MFNKLWFSGIMMLVLLLAMPIAAGAQEGLSIGVTTEVLCDSVSFASDFFLQDEFEPYTVRLEFGDGAFFEENNVLAGPYALNEDHFYPSASKFAWNLTITGVNNFEEITEGEVAIDAPFVTLNSTPSPPLLTIDGGKALIDFWTVVEGGEAPYSYSWDLDEDGSPDTGLSSAATDDYMYTAGGNYKAAVTVTDSGGCSLTDTLTVVVVDPEADPQDACHPTAQKIAEAVSVIFLSDRAESTYTCEDIFNIFEGALTGNHIGFGRLWHAYQLTQTIPDLTWEEIRDWKLEYSSWGALAQLNRVSEFLDEHGIRELYDLVVSEGYTLRDIRTAARNVLRNEADFEDALARIAEGANAGELGQFYRLVNELEVDPEELDVYLADGMSLSDLRHATKFAERTDADWTEILDAKVLDASWGEIGQAYKLADGETSVEEILSLGVNEYRNMQREEERAQREEERNTRAAEREEERVQGTNDRDLHTADQIASKYGVSSSDVMKQLEACNQDWNCVRAYYRDSNREAHGKDKKK
jgi:PKD repeat protein